MPKKRLHVTQVGSALVEEERRGRMPKWMSGDDRHPSACSSKLDPGVECLIAKGSAVAAGKGEWRSRKIYSPTPQPHASHAFEESEPFLERGGHFFCEGQITKGAAFDLEPCSDQYTAWFADDGSPSERCVARIAFNQKITSSSLKQTALDIYDNTESCNSVKAKNQVRSPGGHPGCPSKPPLVERPLLKIETAAELARVYETLANDTRIRLLHVLLKEGEIYPSGLAKKLGMKPQAVSNQLQRLLDRGIVQTRRNGNNVLYRVVDSCVIELIDRGLCLLEDTRSSQVGR